MPLLFNLNKKQPRIHANAYLAIYQCTILEKGLWKIPLEGKSTLCHVLGRIVL